MSIETELKIRSESGCELCRATDNLRIYEVPPVDVVTADQCILICNTCYEQIEEPEKVDINHWRCLNDSMWNQEQVVQVVAWRMLTRLSAEGWPQDLLDMLYLDDDTMAWAQALAEGQTSEDEARHIDSNGTVLTAGDTVILIKDLNVKGASFTAKRGTAVRGISLVEDNPEHIEGRVNGQQIVILTCFVKKSA